MSEKLSLIYLLEEELIVYRAMLNKCPKNNTDGKFAISNLAKVYKRLSATTKQHITKERFIDIFNAFCSKGLISQIETINNQIVYQLIKKPDSIMVIKINNRLEYKIDPILIELAQLFQRSGCAVKHTKQMQEYLQTTHPHLDTLTRSKICDQAESKLIGYNPGRPDEQFGFVKERNESNAVCLPRFGSVILISNKTETTRRKKMKKSVQKYILFLTPQEHSLVYALMCCTGKGKYSRRFGLPMNEQTAFEKYNIDDLFSDAQTFQSCFESLVERGLIKHFGEDDANSHYIFTKDTKNFVLKPIKERPTIVTKQHFIDVARALQDLKQLPKNIEKWLKQNYPSVGGSMVSHKITNYAPEKFPSKGWGIYTKTKGTRDKEIKLPAFRGFEAVVLQSRTKIPPKALSVKAVPEVAPALLPAKLKDLPTDKLKSIMAEISAIIRSREQTNILLLKKQQELKEQLKKIEEELKKM